MQLPPQTRQKQKTAPKRLPQNANLVQLRHREAFRARNVKPPLSCSTSIADEFHANRSTGS